MSAADTVRGRTVQAFGTAVALAAAGVLTLGACGGSSGPAPGSSAPSSSAPAGTPAGSSGAAGDSAGSGAGQGGGQTAGLEKAGAAAVAKVAGGTLVSIELERHGTAWEAQVVSRDGTEHEMDVSASTGAVTSAHAKREGAADRAKHRTRIAEAKVDYADAAKKIRAAVRGGRITELNLDGHRGGTVWEADVDDHAGVRHEVKLNAANGAVLADHTSTGGDD